MALSLVTAPSNEPVDMATAKKQIRREDVTDDDELIDTILIPAVRQRCEDATARQLMATATWDLKMDGFPACGWIDVPKPPLLTVVSLTYVDGSGVSQVWDPSNYLVDVPTGPRCARGRITPAYGVSWPTTRDQMNAVVVRFTAGYGTTGASIPPRLKLAMLQDLGSMYEHREDLIVGQGFVISEMPTSAQAVYRRYRSFPRQRIADGW